MEENFAIVPMFRHFLSTKLVQERYILNYFIKKKDWQADGLLHNDFSTEILN